MSKKENNNKNIRNVCCACADDSFEMKYIENSAAFNLDQGSIENCGRLGSKIMLFLTVHEMVIPNEL